MQNSRKASTTDFACANCKNTLHDVPEKNNSEFESMQNLFPGTRIHATGVTSLSAYPWQCKVCKLPYGLSQNTDGVLKFWTDHQILLAKSNPMQYLHWRLKQLNGWVSSNMLLQASCSVVGNQRSEEFRVFILDALGAAHKILDIGCGPTKLPIYLSTADLDKQILIGLDPFSTEFLGTQLDATCENIPLVDGCIDLVICASTIDHFMNLQNSVTEIARVVSADGLLAIWDHGGQGLYEDRLSFRDRIHLIKRSNYHVIQRSRYMNYRIYDNGVVFPIKRRDNDPFHSIESRKYQWKEKLNQTITNSGFSKIREHPSGFSLWKKMLPPNL